LRRTRAKPREKLNLDAAGVKLSSLGIEVNAYLQTSQPHIYAAGDIVGPYQFTHTADAQARVVVRNILMPFQILRQKMDYSVVPWCTYTAPEIARVGLNETEAKQQNISYDLICVQIDELDRAVVEGEELGFVKVLTAKGTDKILGVTMVATHAGDLLHEFVLAMKQRIGLGRLATTIHSYPTFGELGRKVGDHYNKQRLTPFVKRIFRWLYKLSRAASAPTSARVPHAGLRTRMIGWFLGDQAIFARRETFEKLGGFRDLELFEDLDFSMRMRQTGRVVTLSPPRDFVVATVHLPWTGTYDAIRRLADMPIPDRDRSDRVSGRPARLHAAQTPRGTGLGARQGTLNS
jgi:hypothetical protein